MHVNLLIPIHVISIANLDQILPGPTIGGAVADVIVWGVIVVLLSYFALSEGDREICCVKCTDEMCI